MSVQPYITTFTGKHVNPLNPRVEDIDIRDIAHSLALTNRFAGHTQNPISVAQHSVHVSRLVPRSAALYALLHDASEAYLGDVTKWLKNAPEFETYRKAETRVMMTILMALDIPVMSQETLDWTDWADKLMVRYEAEQQLPGHQFPPHYLPTTEDERNRVGPWEPWGWYAAETLFLFRYEFLIGRIETDFTPGLLRVG